MSNTLPILEKHEETQKSTEQKAYDKTTQKTKDKDAIENEKIKEWTRSKGIPLSNKDPEFMRLIQFSKTIEKQEKKSKT